MTARLSPRKRSDLDDEALATKKSRTGVRPKSREESEMEAAAIRQARLTM